MLIYRIKNRVNNKSYIGMTTLTLEQRKKEHFKKFQGKERYQALYKAFDIYGWDSFEWEELCCTWNRDHMINLERYFIDYFDSYSKGYNMTYGGDGVISGHTKKYYLVRNPDGTETIVHGLKEFCRMNNLSESRMLNTYNKKPRYDSYTRVNGSVSNYTKQAPDSHRGYTLLRKFNDQSELSSYLEAEGNGGHPNRDEDMVSSTGKLVAA